MKFYLMKIIIIKDFKTFNIFGIIIANIFIILN